MSKHGSNYNEQFSEVEGLVEVNYETRDYDGIRWIRHDHYEHALTTHGAKERERAAKIVEEMMADHEHWRPIARRILEAPQTDVTK